MVKINKYLILIQLFALTLIGQSIIQCAARIQTEQSATKQDLELIENARLGNKDKVKQLIKSGTNVNAVDKDGWTALMAATYERHKEIVELLIKANANVNVANKNGNTALMGAAQFGLKEIVKLLINRGVDVNAAHQFGRTALIWASVNGYKEIVELLIKANADINACDIHRFTALLYAARYKYKEIVELLLKAGANIEHKNLSGETVSDLARWESETIKKNKQEIVIMIEGEQSRREAVVKKWIKEILARKITEVTSEQLFSDISNIIAEYCSIEYTNIPLEYRLAS